MAALVADTFDGKIHIEWDQQAQVTPLSYASNNAPKKVNVLGSFLLSILVGHTRYAHLTSLMGDTVNARLLGMTKVISDDCARRALYKIDEADGIRWLQIIAAIGPPISFLGFAVAGIELWHRRFIGMKTGPLSKMPSQSFRQRLPLAAQPSDLSAWSKPSHPILLIGQVSSLSVKKCVIDSNVLTCDKSFSSSAPNATNATH